MTTERKARNDRAIEVEVIIGARLTRAMDAIHEARRILNATGIGRRLKVAISDALVELTEAEKLNNAQL